jgi:signal transduction histidine kinase/CheY-like chemotaxis protein
MTTLVVMAVIAITLLSIRREQQTFKAELQNQARLLLDTLSSTSADRLYFLDQEFLAGIMQKLGDDHVVIAGRIFDGQGRIVADAHDPGIVYRAENDPFGARLVQSDEPVFEWQSDQLLAGQAVVAGRERLGAITVTLSAVPLKEKMDAVRSQGLSVALAAALIGMVLALLVSRSIIGPLQALTEATERIASGELTHQIAIRSGDELGILAHSFNHMAAELALSRQQLERWNQTLERTVEQRTTELVQAMAVVQEARVTAEQASQLKSQFLANMSHELRTPLNAIINFTRFLSKERYGSLTERQTELQQRVLANADHLLGLINDILDLSKIESGRMELVYEELDLAPVLQSVMSTASGLTKEKQLGLTLDVPHSLPLVRIDKTRIRQVLLNLLSNAAKFTNQGGISVRAHVIDEQMLCIAVQDTGIGIAPEHQNLVFEEFRQVQGELTREYEGSGLGLSISKRLVELHGGRMWLESTLGTGSTFFFTLPVYQPAPVLNLPPEPAIDPSRPVVVVVDDDPNAQQIFRHYLESAGYSVCAVLDSRQALETIQQCQPDLVILDVLMPHFDGWEVLTQLKSMPETAAIPVIICSIVEQQQLGLALGAHAYLVKPVREEDFLALVQQLAPASTRILVIDDNPDTQQIVSAMLEGHGCQVVAAEDGVQGWEAVQEQRPDLILLDLMMPRMDGFELLERLRADPAHAMIPVVVITAKELEPHEREWLLSRTQSCLQKNQLTAAQFVDYIHQVLGMEAIDVDRS